jgi:Zn-dependent protease with chaperone function
LKHPLTLSTIAASLLLGGCAATTESGRERVVAPGEIGAVYSEVEVQTRLAFTPDASCEPDCAAADAFREQVWALAQRLDVAARAFGRERGQSVPAFNVSVPGKDDIGTLSSAAGNLIVFDGVRQMALPAPALAFLIAREMGHVVSLHHEENTATGLAVSLAIAIAFPVVGLIQGAQAAYAATTLPMTLASSVASFAGSRVMRALYKQDQRREADEYALQILMRAGWSPYAVAAALHEASPHIGEDGWMGQLRDSQAWLALIVTGPQPPTPAELAATTNPAPATPAVAAASIPPAAAPVRAPRQPPAPSSPPVRVVPPAPVLKMNVPKSSQAACQVRVIRGVKQLTCKTPSGAPASTPAVKSPTKPGKAATLRPGEMPAKSMANPPTAKPRTEAKSIRKTAPKPAS